MKITCLFVRQPWATAIVHSAKWCENRSRRSSYVGELWIHASRWDDADPADPDLPGPEPESEVEAVERYGYPTPTGALVGRATMLGCWPAEQIELARAGRVPDDPRLMEALRVLAAEPKNFFGWESVSGPWCYLLADRRPLAKPVPMKGKLGLWTAEVELQRPSALSPR
jgi:hypothetical protein